MDNVLANARLLRGIAVIAMLMLGLAVLSGCASQAPQQATGAQASAGAAGTNSQNGASGNPSPADSGTTVASGQTNAGKQAVVDVATENKTGYQKTQDAVALAVADGTYTTVKKYAYHSGNTTVNFTLAVKNDVITEASAAPSGKVDEVSTKIIGKFDGALPDLVVGKKITELNIPKNVAGSSLTTAEFKTYIDGLVAAGKGV